MTEPEKWRDLWFRNLSPEQKLVFLFLIDQCDWGGFYEIDAAYMSFCIGLDEEAVLGALEGLARGCVVVDGWVWIKNFLRHQKNEKLNPGNNAHKNIIDRINEQLTRFALVPEFDEFLGAYKGLISPIGNGKGKGQGRGKTEFDPLKIELPDNLKTTAFLAAWSDWITHRKEIKKALTPTATKQQIEKLAKMADPVGAIKHSLAAGYQGIFEPTTNGKPIAPQTKYTKNLAEN